jgi:rod shape-determining protein MreC
MLRAWYTFLALGLLTFIFNAFVGAVPVSLSSAVALPHNALYAAGYTLRQLGSSLIDRRDHRAEIERLQTALAELEAERRRLELELASAEQMQRVRQAHSPGVVMTAAVSGIDASPLLARMTLAAGRRHGVVLHMPVTVPEGLVGVVIDTSERSSVVRLITDPESRIGVTVRGKGGQGVAVGELGGLVRVTNYVESAAVEVGDLIETSSRGGLFPRGILVGRVAEVLPQDPNSLRVEFLVEPAVDLANLLEVVLIEPL